MVKIPDFNGVFPPMMTPFTLSGDPDYDAHVRNLDRWNKDELAGYLVLGSNSETPYLNETEKLRLIEVTAERAAPGRLVLAGTGLESTRETVRLTNLAAEKGAQAALVLTPSFYSGQMKDDALVNHFRKVADGAHIPVLIYNVPAYTHLMIPVEAVVRLSDHPNIIGMKDSSGDVPRLATLAGSVPKKFNLIVGTASAWYPALLLGVRAGILALANFAGNACARVQKLVLAGKLDEARDLYLKLVPVNAAVTSIYGVPGLKCAASLLGYEGAHVRSPLLPLPEEFRERMKKLLCTAGLM